MGRGRWLIAMSFVGGCVSLDGLAVPEPSSAGDAGSDAVVDAPDGPPPDVSSPQDGSFCARQTSSFFCTDFSSDDPGAGFDYAKVHDGGLLARDLDTRMSPPASLRASVHEGEQLTRAMLVKEGPSPTRRIALSFAFRVKSLESTKLTYGQLGFADAYFLNFDVQSGKAAIQEAAPNDAGTDYTFTDLGIARTPSPGVWQRLKVEVVYESSTSGTKSFVSAWLDGDLVLERAAVQAERFPGPVYALVGAAFRGAPPMDWTVWYDDVLLEIE